MLPLLDALHQARVPKQILRKGWGCESQEVVRKSKGQCERKPKTPGKKNRKAKESTRKLFCVSLFLAKWGENKHKRKRQRQ